MIDLGISQIQGIDMLSGEKSNLSDKYRNPYSLGRSVLIDPKRK